MTATPSHRLLTALLSANSTKLFRALQEAFREADKIPGCDASVKALFHALYLGGLCDGPTLDQRTNYQYHEAIEKLTSAEVGDGAAALAEVVREKDRQILIASLGKGISDLSSGAKPESVSDEIRSALKAIRGQDGWPLLGEYVTGTIRSLEESARTGIELTSGLGELDGLFTFRRNNLVTVGARTSHGKTAFATRMVCRGLRGGLSVAYLCFEDYGTWLMKFASQFHQVPLEKFTKYHMQDARGRAEAESALELCRQFDGLTVVPGMRLSEFSNVIEKLDHKPDLIVFDYLQKCVEMFGSDMKKNEAAARMTSDFQEMVRKYNAFGIMTSQISRAPQEMRGKPPSLDGLKESGDIENYSDAVLLLWYPWKDKLEGDRLNMEKYKIFVAKNKLGTTDSVECRFNGATLTLENKYAGVA